MLFSTFADMSLESKNEMILESIYELLHKGWNDRQTMPNHNISKDGHIRSAFPFNMII